MDIYRELILDHYKNPRNFGHLAHPDVKVEEGNATCGDVISMEIAVDDAKRVGDIRFSGEGCAISQAAASLLTEKAKGMKLSDIMKIDAQEMVRLLGTTLTPSRTRCAVLSLEVLQKAVLKILP